MSDLIERLREGVHGKTVTLTDGLLNSRLHEAADQLEAQQAEIAQLKSQYSDVNEQLFSASLAYENEHIEKSNLETEIARLREALIIALDSTESVDGANDCRRGIVAAEAALEQKP